MSWLFDGEQEINLKLERGQSFGLSKVQYGALAHIAMGALRMGGSRTRRDSIALPKGGPVAM